MVEDLGSILLKVGFFSVIFTRISNTSYHLQYLYCQGGYVFGAKANLITCVAEFFFSAAYVAGRADTSNRVVIPVARLGIDFSGFLKGTNRPDWICMRVVELDRP
jgi:hypothetical protein